MATIIIAIVIVIIKNPKSLSIVLLIPMLSASSDKPIEFSE
mgnify:CR=1 FL=1